MDKQKTKLAAIDLAQIAIFTALMVVGAFIKIPFPMVPLTFQTVFCVLAGLMLGWKKAGISMLIYMIMGLIGIPVFTAGGGIGYVVKPSFGYIIGFIVAAIGAGAVRGKDVKVTFIKYALGAFVGFILNYIVGIVYFIAVWQINGYSALGSSIVTYNLLYMPKDIVLCALAAILAWKVTPIVAKIGVEKKKDIDKEEILSSAEDSETNI